MLSKDEIKTAVEGAFRPLRCFVVIWDYDRQLKFSVWNDEKMVRMFASVWVERLCNRDYLESYLLSARDRVEEQGYTLEPWNLP
jgi:hypothetical protein